ncbi:Detected protein of confused Function [Hibiscus syriacus]|uniref:Detected protein of confused Function n=1 Tax=Hibiscus syriacus TaxID=106335 RepID=A0A6A2Y3X0_HIBSY|nr:Detected protein of confused Function [Hibiscus syriacus]
MVTGGKVGHRSNFKKRGRSKEEDSDGSDEDYVVSDEGNEESEDDVVEYCSSSYECASEESYDDEEEKVMRKADRLKAKQMRPARKRKIVERKPIKQRGVSDEEDDEDYEVEEEDDEEEYEVEKEEEGEEEDEEEYDDEENDVEFTLDEEDCFDEEEELTVTKKKNNMKVRKKGLRKKGHSKQRKKTKKSAVSKKLSRNRGRKKRLLKRKRRVEEEDDEYYFALSGASDYEYTISEEEREQGKETSRLCGSLKTSLRSSSSSKIIEEVEELGQHKKPPGRKGKEKVEEKKAEVIKSVCGICLSEEDKRRFRGTLNCCNHYFCFTCIMAWSKVESRCPLCKQRFETISKPTRSMAGVDLKEVVIQVPKCDQVYQPSEEELRSYLDPYENVFCSECHQGGDDELMLLCDLCDSSAHTYCVGLGREVPDGNWYCDGCRPVALGSSGSQVQDSLPDQRTNNLYNRFSPVVIVGESLDSNVVPSPRMPLTPGFVGISSPRFPSVDVTAGSPVSGAGAPTLTGRRWLHRQIQNLRSINRMNLMAGRGDGIPAVNTDIDFVNSHIDQSRGPTVQQARIQDVGTQPQIVFEERSQDYPSSSLQSRGFFSSRLDHLRRQGVQDLTTPSLSTPVNLTLWPELAVAKEQLHAMVRSHLKAFSNGIDLDNGTLKDITTSSMHTLLAACGLEHRSSEVQIVPPSSICVHIERVAAGQASLMKGCCLTCFDSFVKDVVKRIMDARSRRWLSLGL